MKIFIDTEFKCHVADDGAMTPVETDYFNGKCSAYIEGYRFIPAGQRWADEDGEVYEGEMAAPWLPFNALHAIQREYEREQMVDMQEALTALGVNVSG